MILKSKILEKGPMVLTGSKVLKSIMDKTTPPADLFIREVIQNSLDAILQEKAFGKISINIGSFSNINLCNSLDGINEVLYRQMGDEEYPFISISDSNTCGLLGEPFESKNGEPNNLYNLVYDFMNGKSDSDAGGSWGIGKSVYYRYGKGLCFYYSRTFEKGKYISKLAGALIQEEKRIDCFLGKDSSGIAYFGDLKDDKSIPIYDEELIHEFLSIFGIKPYKNDETGTTVIIPYIDEEKILSNTINKDESEKKYWINDLPTCLSMSLQRWYFARLNNQQYNGKYIVVAINNVKVELNKFYQTLQDLYNGKIEGATYYSVGGGKFNPTQILGTFKYKIFDKEELGINTPPYNYPSAQILVDKPDDSDNEEILFYMRKPGMVINYDISNFGHYTCDEGKCLIGMFVLNDDLVVDEEILGRYIRKSEQANHKEWNDPVLEEYPSLSKKKPFKQIVSSIKTHLKAKFKQDDVVKIEGSSTLLQKKLGQKLLPPSDFGNKPETPTKKEPGDGITASKSKKVKVFFNGLNDEGLLSYTFEGFLVQNDVFKIVLEVKAGSKSYSFSKWENLGFDIPCSIMKISVNEFYINSKKFTIESNIKLDSNFTKRKKKTDEVHGVLYKVRGLSSENGEPCGIKFSNPSDHKLRISVNFLIKPVDLTFAIGFETNVENGGED